MPQNIFMQKRALNIVNAMHRYVTAYKHIPKEWYTELKTLEEYYD